MTILEAIKEAHEATEIGVKNLHYATTQEFNSFENQLKGLDFPVNLVAPIIVNGDMTKLPRIGQTVNIQGFMLTRINEDTNNVRSLSLEENYLSPLRHKAKLFLSALMQTDIVNPEVSTSPFVIRPEYWWLSSHIFGVSYTLTLPTYSDVC